MEYYMLKEFNFKFYSVVMLLFMFKMFFLLIGGKPMTLLLGWEFLGLTSFILIIYYQSWESCSNGMVTLLTMRFGDLLFFTWLSYIGFKGILKKFDSFFNVGEILLLLMVKFTKSAQIPFSGWLPKAMSAPTPTSALVHSSTLVVAGFVMIITYSECVVGGLLVIMFFFGWLTMLIGSLAALSEFSIKRLVAFSTLSQMGMAMMTFGLGNFLLGYVHLISHGFLKSLLFMSVGFFIHSQFNNQEARVWNMGGKIKNLVVVCSTTSLSALCGLLYTSGMGKKEVLLEMSLQYPLYLFMVLCLISVIFFTLIYSFYIWSFLFNKSQHPMQVLGNSVMCNFSLVIMGGLTIFWFVWLVNNSFNPAKFKGHIEHLIPVLFLLCLWLVWNYWVMSKFSNLIFYLNHVPLNIHYYSWLSWNLSTSFYWVELYMYNFLSLVRLSFLSSSVSTAEFLRMTGPMVLVSFLVICFLIL